MPAIRNTGVFTTSGGDRGDAATEFAANDDFSVGIFAEEDVESLDLPSDVGIAFIRSSDSPRDFATISLNGNNTSTIYVDNTDRDCTFVVSGDTFVGYSVNTDFDSLFRFRDTVPDIFQSPYTYNYYDRGNLYVSGSVYAAGVVYGENLAGTIKFFNIPHPTKENKRLVHACLEGPENGVYVRGRLTDSSVIELPDYWSGLVDPETISVTLTQIGYSQDLIVDRIEWGRRVVIKSGSGANIDCYYTVNATRKDVPPLVVEP